MKKNNQPSWHCVANFGDATPEDHGGAFLMIDKRGIYTPELWVFEPDEEDEKKGRLCRFSIEHLTRCKGNENCLSDNRFHNDIPAWFGKESDLKRVAETFGVSFYTLHSELQGAPGERAHHYYSLFFYHGADNFGGWEDIERREAVKLCKKAMRQIQQAEKWVDGF